MVDATFSNTVYNLSKSLHPMALKLTYDSEAAKDLIQETIVKAITNKDKYREGTNLKAWLYTIMRNTFINNYKRTTKRQISNNSVIELDVILTSTGKISENKAQGNMVMKDIDHAIEEIDENLSMPFVMYVRGFKYKEISEMLEIPIGTVKNRIHIARKELQSLLKDYSKNIN